MNKIKKGMTVETNDGAYIIRDINRSMTPALVMLTEKYKKKGIGRRMYVRENLFKFIND
jgi:hypothetical protein